jgi:hypothetical protein
LNDTSVTSSRFISLILSEAFFKVKCSDCEIFFIQKNLLTNLAGNKGRLDEINSLAEEIVKSGSGQSKQVQVRQKEINDRWAS